jgi:hypothetical protein
VIKSHDVGTIQYIEWLILIDRVQPSFIAGVLQGEGWCLLPVIIARTTTSPVRERSTTTHERFPVSDTP